MSNELIAQCTLKYFKTVDKIEILNEQKEITGVVNNINWYQFKNPLPVLRFELEQNPATSHLNVKAVNSMLWLYEYGLNIPEAYEAALDRIGFRVKQYQKPENPEKPLNDFEKALKTVYLGMIEPVAGPCDLDTMLDFFSYEETEPVEANEVPIAGDSIIGAKGIPHQLDNWANRSQSMICATCVSFVSKGATSTGAILGRCRRHAPTMSGFPAVFATDFCFDHKLDESKI